MPFEKHFTPQELVESWGFSEDYIRRLFKEEEGVFIDTRPETRKKRQHTNIRVPESVALRVYARHTMRKRRV
jgi:hypothetical protein